MIVFLSGPITGVEDYREKFAAAEAQLIDQGHVVLNPAVLPFGLEHGQYMAICYPMLVCADEVAQLPGWENSTGALIEHRWAQALGKSCWRIEAPR
jgi:hypothetical protein